LAPVEVANSFVSRDLAVVVDDDDDDGGIIATRITPEYFERDCIDRLAALLNLNVTGSDANTNIVSPSFVVTTNCTPVMTFSCFVESDVIAQMPSFFPGVADVVDVDDAVIRLCCGFGSGNKDTEASLKGGGHSISTKSDKAESSGANPVYLAVI